MNKKEKEKGIYNNSNIYYYHCYYLYWISAYVQPNKEEKFLFLIEET